MPYQYFFYAKTKCVLISKSKKYGKINNLILTAAHKPPSTKFGTKWFSFFGAVVGNSVLESVLKTSYKSFFTKFSKISKLF